MGPAGQTLIKRIYSEKAAQKNEGIQATYQMQKTGKEKREMNQ